MKKLRLNLGCGRKQKEGFINIDKDEYGQELIQDIEKDGLPYKDNEIYYITAFSFFEHLENPIKVFNECWRVLKTDGYLELCVPNAETNPKDTFGDLTHKSYFTKETFTHYLQEGPDYYDFTDKQWKIFEINAGDMIYLKMKPKKEK